jgi:dTDP-glucose 4,6-dehydratase
MRVLVTGGAGFIGSNYVRRAVSGAYEGLADADVVVLDALTYAGVRENLAPVQDDPRLEFVHGDICDVDLVDSLMARVDQVVHFAAESHVDRSIHGAGEFVRTNVLGTQTLLDAALRHGIERFVHVSTDEVYGSIDEGSWTEDRPLEPNSPYSASKASSDLLARAYFRTHGLPVKVIPLFVTNLMDGKKVPLYGDGLNVRDWLHVDDHCRGIELVRSGGKAGETYNIGGGTELTNRELTERLLAASGKDWSSVEPVQDRKGHDRRYSVDISKISAELGYAPEVPFEQGLADTVAWYREHRDWWEPLKKRSAG